MAGFTVQIQGIDEFVSRYRGSERVFEEELGRSMKLTMLESERRLKSVAPVGQGGLRDSIGSEIAPIAGGVRGAAGPDKAQGVAGATKSYAVFVVRGRGPGGMPPIENIVDWVKVKNRYTRSFGINSNNDKEVRQVAWRVARGIAKRGTKPNDFMDRALALVRPYAETQFRKEMPKRIAERMTGGGR